MKEPTITEAYAMLRILRKRGEKGDGQKITMLQDIIDKAKDKRAQGDLEKYFPGKP